MNEFLLIGGAHDGQRIDTRGERHISLPVFPDAGFVVPRAFDQKDITIKIETFHALDLHVDGRLLSVYVHECLSAADAVQKLIDCYKH